MRTIQSNEWRVKGECSKRGAFVPIPKAGFILEVTDRFGVVAGQGWSTEQCHHKEGTKGLLQLITITRCWGPFSLTWLPLSPWHLHFPQQVALCRAIFPGVISFGISWMSPLMCKQLVGTCALQRVALIVAGRGRTFCSKSGCSRDGCTHSIRYPLAEGIVFQVVDATVLSEA